MTFEEAYAHLNEEQKAAVNQIEGPVMVLAGPGTGKTQMIALRIAQILRETQVSPHNILCLTFTESGAAAMRKRLIEFIGETAYGVRIHTFHSFCNEVIQDYPTEFLFARELSALTDIERIQFFREVLDSQKENSPLRPFGDPYFYLRDIRQVIQDLKREAIAPEALEEAVNKVEAELEKHGEAIATFCAINGGQLKAETFEEMKAFLEGSLFAPFLSGDSEDKKARTAMKGALKEALESWQNHLPKQRSLVELYRAYQSLLKKRGRYDFEDMIALVIEKLKSNAKLLARYQEQFQYILVDEYQDTNSAQNELVRLLGSYFESPNIFVVGDDKQSIYRFQGASLENLLLFYSLYKKSIQVVSLRENYRSQQSVLDAAHSLISHSQESLAELVNESAEALHANAPHAPEPIQIAELGNADTERYFIAQNVQSLIEAGVRPSEIAILYRNNREADGLIDLFLRMNIPFHLSGGHDLLHDKDIQKLLTVMRYLANLNDESQLFFILNFDWFNFDQLAIARITREAHDKRKSLLESLKNSELFADFADKLLYWHKQSINLPMAEFFDLLIKDSGYLAHALAQDNKLERLNRLNTLFDEIKQWNYGKTDRNLVDFMAYLDLLKENKLTLPEKELQTQKDAVRLMTAHRSKGLEFEYVFIMNLVDKTWGNAISRDRLELPIVLTKTTHISEKLDEERRLFFVALTRAKKRVTLTYAQKTSEGRSLVPSLFLGEIPEPLKAKMAVEAVEDAALNQLQTIFLDAARPAAEDHKAYITSLLQNYTLSVTHLNNYLRCPLLFYYNNVLRVPFVKNKNLVFGTAIHEALKDLLMEVKRGSTPGKDELLERYEKHLSREILSQKEWEALLVLGKETLGNYYDHYVDSFRPNVELEYDFRSHSVVMEGVPITGKLDKIQLLDEADRTVHTVDYKTGLPDNKSAELRPGGEYHRQIVFYKLLCDYSKRFPYQMVSGEIDFVQASKSGDFIRKVINVTPEDIENLKTQIKDVYKDIMNLRFLELDEFERCGQCDWCTMMS